MKLLSSVNSNIFECTTVLIIMDFMNTGNILCLSQTAIIMIYNFSKPEKHCKYKKNIVINLHCNKNHAGKELFA